MFGISDHMDYDGQRKAERIFQVIVVLFATIGWVTGYYLQQFSISILILGGGFALASLIIIPPWPVFRRSPLKWAPTVQTEDSKKKKK